MGTCAPANATGPSAAWYAAAPGNTPTLLQPLVSGKNCGASGIADDGVIVGSCANASNISFAVVWSSSTALAPTQLQPLSLLQTGLLADVSTAATAYNQNGVVIGESISGSGAATPVVWSNGSSTPIIVGPYASNCAAVDDTQTTVNGQPSIALDCPTNPSSANPGPSFGAIAQNTALLGGFVVNKLPLPTDATNCSVSGLNDSVQAVGTCRFSNSAGPQAAFWATPTSTPILASLSGSPNSTGVFINASGNVALNYLNSNGLVQAAFWNTTTDVVSPISPLTGGTTAVVTCLGDNNTVTLTSEIGNQQPEAAEWTPATGNTVALGDLNGGQESGAGGCNKGGTAAIVDGQDSNQNQVGGESNL